MVHPPHGRPSIGCPPGPENVPPIPTVPFSERLALPALGLALGSTIGLIAPAPPALRGLSPESPRNGVAGMGKPETGSLLVDYYATFLRDHNIDDFRQQVSARSNEGTLGRLVESGSLEARRAAVLALGLFGSFQSNAVVARGLRDTDPTVRELADNAL